MCNGDIIHKYTKNNPHSEDRKEYTKHQNQDWLFWSCGTLQMKWSGIIQEQRNLYEGMKKCVNAPALTEIKRIKKENWR